MKLTKLITLGLMLVSFAAAQMAGGPHDLTTGGSNATADTDQLCAFCHTPHKSAASTLLWNKTVSTTAAVFNEAGQSVTQGAETVLCMTCHDGANSVLSLTNSPKADDTALSSTGEDATIFTAGILTGNGDLGTALGNDHPVGVDYAASELATSHLNTLASISVPLFGGQVECATCHDVHATAGDKLLRVASAGSLICSDCHNR